MAYPQGGVVLAHDPFGDSSNRPYLLLSDDRHPFHGQEYIAAVVTTTARERAIHLEADSFEDGSLPLTDRMGRTSPSGSVTRRTLHR